MSAGVKIEPGTEGFHGGGAWKVAYADFVTAMMALFMVLWISSQDEEILISTSDYFANPFNSPMEKSLGVMPNTSNSIGGKAKEEPDPNNVVDAAMLYQLAKEFYRLLNLDEEDEDKPLEIEVTSDGLRITVFDRSKQPLFKKGTSEFTPWGIFAMQNLAWIMERYNTKVRIDAHDAKANGSMPSEYDPWEMTVDRANAARRSLVHFALDQRKVERVTGYADSKPLSKAKGEAKGNQRLEISMVMASFPGPRS